jgi:hypothetical protein
MTFIAKNSRDSKSPDKTQFPNPGRTETLQSGSGFQGAREVIQRLPIFLPRRINKGGVRYPLHPKVFLGFIRGRK